jgi:hypothetical protein
VIDGHIEDWLAGLQLQLERAGRILEIRELGISDRYYMKLSSFIRFRDVQLLELLVPMPIPTSLAITATVLAAGRITASANMGVLQ